MQLYNTGACFLNREIRYNYMNVWKSSIKNFAVMKLNFNTVWSMQVKQSCNFMEQAFSHQ